MNGPIVSSTHHTETRFTDVNQIDTVLWAAI